MPTDTARVPAAEPDSESLHATQRVADVGDIGGEDIRSQRLVPAAGLPAITVPVGFSYGELPAGLQLVGRPYDEGLLFRLAHAYEQGTGHRRPPALFPPLGERSGAGLDGGE